MMNFEIKNENGVLTGILNGRLDSAIANQLEKDMQPLMDSADKDIVLDCTGLEYISSSGLRLFLALRKEVAKKGGTLALSHITMTSGPYSPSPVSSTSSSFVEA